MIRTKYGDSYLLVANLTGTSAKVYTITTHKIVRMVNLFPNLDLAVLRVILRVQINRMRPWNM